MPYKAVWQGFVSGSSFLRRRTKQEGCRRLIILSAALAAAVAFPTFTVDASSQEDIRSLIEKEFHKYDPNYDANRQTHGARLATLGARLAAAETQGQNLHCSQQIFLEAKWLHRYTARWDELTDKLARLEQSLTDPEQNFAARQLPTDGLWGPCYDAWYMRVGATIIGLADLARRGERPRYQVRGSGQIDTGKKLLQRFQDLLVSDIANTGVDNRGELGSLLTSIAQVLFKQHIRNSIAENLDLTSSVDLNALTEAFKFFLRGSQDRNTGYWGAWYVIDGIVHKTTDLSMTYHIIAYTKGDVDHWPQIIATTEAIEADEYPYGWRKNGRYNNHNIYDVAKIFKFGWPHMSTAERARISAQTESLLNWSLHNTLDENGSFIHDPSFSDSFADEYYFGVSFLEVIGYWSREKRFWTDKREFEGAAALCCQLKRQLEAFDLEGWAADGANEKLARSCAVC
jgi:hypothetical protein